MEETKETFTYTYSAKEQEEIKKIRDKYAPPTKEETTLERLRRLDRSATRGASVVSTVVGTVSAGSRVGEVFHSGNRGRHRGHHRRYRGVPHIRTHGEKKKGEALAGDIEAQRGADEMKNQAFRRGTPDFLRLWRGTGGGIREGALS